LAQNLQIDVGDNVKIVVPQTGVIEGFTVHGFFDTGTEVDNTFALTTINAAQKLSPWPDKVTGLRLKVEDVFLASSVGSYIRSRVLNEPGYYTTNWSRTHSNLYYAIQRISGFVISFNHWHCRFQFGLYFSHGGGGQARRYRHTANLRR
jgi:lipoprotein-releasing system permease protein